MRKPLYAVPGLLLTAACRFGGPSGDPTALIEVDGGLPADHGEVDGRVAADTGAMNGQGAVDNRSRDAGQLVPAQATDAARSAVDAKSAAADPAQAAHDGSGCDAPDDLDCDPVSGDGCLPFLEQCIVDPASSEPAATCVLGGIQLDDTCTQDEFSTDCPPQYTCVMGQCRKYCYCDADCDLGTACKDPSGEGGSTVFKLCQLATP